MPSLIVPIVLLLLTSVVAAEPSRQFQNAIKRLPAAEKQVPLFNGNDLTGWHGDSRYWSVEDGTIRAANDAPLASSTYLLTDRSFRNFRLLLEVRQTLGPEFSTMHSAVCALGEQFADKGDNAFGFRGPLLMFCHDWGIWDAYRRNRVVGRGPGPQVEKKGDWNLIEILVTGNRIQFAANGVRIFDFTDQPEMLRKSPIGLQLHSNRRKQEFHFAGLVLTENPNDRLVTVEHDFSQQPEIQPVQVRGVKAQKDEESPRVNIPDSAFSGEPLPLWIWGPDDNQNYVIEKTFTAKAFTAARLMASCDNVGSISINGKTVASGTDWNEPMTADVTKVLKPGENTIRATCENQGGVAAFVLKLVLQHEDSTRSYVITDTTWTARPVGKKSAGTQVSLRGTYGENPWGAVFHNAPADGGRVPRGVFEVLPGFQVEKLFTVPKEELGSWVCIAFDNKGRLLASDQGGKGICRITLPPVVAGDKTTASSPTLVEQLDFSDCEFQPSGAQGMLYAFDSLYFCCNGGPGSGLYRARDLDGDDQFDECVKLKAFRGGGEHGPHSLRLSPDGKRIFVIAGNHTDPPFQAGEEFQDERYSSRIPTNWGEDLLLPRMWDANGHARGKLAPGGWIASTDPDGTTWDLWSVGYRNPYDMAFNADGELFAYDADMEWDVGTPWYRPTRVVHATSGSEFGWRSGTGKWPEYYVDSLPPMVNIGPGSPVGVDFGYGLRFPQKYQRALYICDWTFGTMYAIHLEPHRSSYRATREEFLSRSPLPLTDCASGPDGALYFTIGGRGTQSELFRVTYVGDEQTGRVTGSDTALADQRSHRRDLEAWHGRLARRTPLPRTGLVNFADRVDEDIRSDDRFLKTALRNAFYNSDLLTEAFDLEGMRALAEQPDPEDDDTAEDIRIGTVVAIAKIPLAHIPSLRDNANAQAEWKQAAQRASLRFLQPIRFGNLSVQQKLDYLRALSLVWIRLGKPDMTQAAAALAALDDQFPDTDRFVNRELCQMLVYLNSPTVVRKTVELMKRPPQREDIDMGDLLSRNAGYGRAIKAMIENQPDQNQVWYAFCLRVAKTGWTPQLRADYFRWFAKAQSWSGGNSFRKFLQNIENEAYDNTPDNDRVMLEALGARTPFKAPELPKPKGPGKAWTLDEVRTLAQNGLKNRSFKNGQRTFAAARCVLCHRFAGEGGATGPDLTQLAGRFNVDALTEAIIDPGKVVSDQYRASTVVTTSGKTITGRIVSDNANQISILVDPEDSTKVVDIPRDRIEEILPSKTSLMPADLLKSLNQEEVLDLLAYLLSRGDERHPMFKK